MWRASRAWTTPGLGALGDHDHRGAGGAVEEQVLDDVGCNGGDVLGRREVDAEREAQPAAGLATGGDEHERLARMEAEQDGDGRHQLARLADPEGRRFAGQRREGGGAGDVGS
jgi:hypothetical protein